jgi:hypothetical protein
MIVTNIFVWRRRSVTRQIDNPCVRPPAHQLGHTRSTLPWKRLIGLTTALALPFALSACPSDDTSDSGAGTNDDAGTGEGTAGTADETGTPAGCADPTDPAATRTEVPAAMDGDTTWTCDQVYVLTEISFVNGGTLTIEPGTTILGAAGSALVIEKDARLDANGTPDAPIVMTSINIGATPARGDWGGLVLIGTAPANIGEGSAEGFADNPPTYGGDDEAHDCGSLSYLRVEWAGYEVSPANELNGITFYSCGTQTSVHHVQVHMGLDDGIEMFGGVFDMSEIVITGAADDSLDFDQGYSGTVTNAFVHHDPTIGDACLEWSNQGNDFTAEPLTNPTIRNLTCVGSGSGGDKSKGVTLKEGLQAQILDSLFANLTNEGVVMINLATQVQAEAGAISFIGSHFCDANTFTVDTANPEDPDPATWTSVELEAWLLGDAGAVTGTVCGLPDVTFGAPNIKPATEIPGDGGYAGAVDPAGEDWTHEAWINYAT